MILPYLIKDLAWKQKASPERFEHSRAKPNRLAGDPVNHSGKVTCLARVNIDI